MRAKLFLILAFSILLQSCGDFSKQIYPDVVACYTYTPDSEIKVDSVIEFSNCSENADKYVWNFGDNAYSTDKNPIHSYDSGGTFVIQLIAIGGLSADTLEESIAVFTIDTTHNATHE